MTDQGNDNLKKAVSVLKSNLLTENVKRSFEENYLEILQRKHVEIPQRYIINFLHKAQLTGANPVLDQIYLIRRWSKAENSHVGVVVFSYHFMLAQANSTGEFERVEVDTKVEEKFNPISGEMFKELVSTATVFRKGKGATPYKAYWSEQSDTRNAQWRDMPYNMLGKCAIAGALRWAFPEALSGVFSEEEITEDETFQEKDNVIDIDEINKRFSEEEILEVEEIRDLKKTGLSAKLPPDPIEHKGITIKTEKKEIDEKSKPTFTIDL